MEQLILKLGGKSRQAWFALLLVILGGMQQNQETLTAAVGDSNIGWVMSGVGVAVYILRVITKKPMAEKEKLLSSE